MKKILAFIAGFVFFQALVILLFGEGMKYEMGKK